jgi:hypothetical protein
MVKRFNNDSGYKEENKERFNLIEDEYSKMKNKFEIDRRRNGEGEGE